MYSAIIKLLKSLKVVFNLLFNCHLLVLTKNKYNLFLVSSLLYISVFSGKFSIYRFFPNFISKDSIFGEIRFWSTILVVFVLGLTILLQRRISLGYSIKVWRPIYLVVLVQFGVLGHTIFYGANVFSTHLIWEILATIVALIVLGYGYELWGDKIVEFMLWTSILCSLILLAIILTSYILLNIPITENPIGTPFTLYRILLFGGFSALMLYFNVRYLKYRTWIILCSIVLISGAYCTLSKAAFIFGNVALLSLIFILFTWFDKKHLKAICTVFLFSNLIFVFFEGKIFTARVEQGLIGIGYSQNFYSKKVHEEIQQISMGETISDEQKNRLTKYFISLNMAKAIACSAGGRTCDYDELDSFERDIIESSLKHYVLIPDYSFRIRLTLHALREISESPWVGWGFGRFSAQAENLYTKEVEIYRYPHNIILELLHAVGILGTSFIFLIYFYLLWEILSKKYLIFSCLPLILFIFLLTSGSLLGGNFTDFRLVWIISVMCIVNLSPTNDRE